MLWVIKRTVSLRRLFRAHRDGSFEHPQKGVEIDG